MLLRDPDPPGEFDASGGEGPAEVLVTWLLVALKPPIASSIFDTGKLAGSVTNSSSPLIVRSILRTGRPRDGPCSYSAA